MTKILSVRPAHIDYFGPVYAKESSIEETNVSPQTVTYILVQASDHITFEDPENWRHKICNPIITSIHRASADYTRLAIEPTAEIVDRLNREGGHVVQCTIKSAIGAHESGSGYFNLLQVKNLRPAWIGKNDTVVTFENGEKIKVEVPDRKSLKQEWQKIKATKGLSGGPV